jgi:hypothetical protein
MFLAAIPAFLLKFLGSGVIESVLNHKKQMAETKTASERIRADVEIKSLEGELKRRELIAELQGKEYRHWALWLPKMLIGLAVAFYIVARFSVKTWGLDDYGIAVSPLDTWEQGVVGIVTAYYFLSK